MKTINVNEYTYVLHKYPGTIKISNEDYEKFNNREISKEEMLEKYSIDYAGYSEPDYDCFLDDKTEYEILK